jgi:hypothetical protein
LAKKAELAIQTVSCLLHRTKQARPDAAKRLAEACKEMGKDISQFDWMTTKATKNIYFFGEPDATPSRSESS